MESVNETLKVSAHAYPQQPIHELTVLAALADHRCDLLACIVRWGIERDIFSDLLRYVHVSESHVYHYFPKFSYIVFVANR